MSTDWTYDSDARILSGSEGSVRLPWRIAETLDVFLAHAGHCVSRDALWAMLFGNVPDADWPETRIMDLRVYRLRKWMLSVGIAEETLETAYGKGWTLHAPNGDVDPRAQVVRLRAALATAIKVAEEARREWDSAPEGMKAGKLLRALADPTLRYRADITEMHAAMKMR